MYDSFFYHQSDNLCLCILFYFILGMEPNRICRLCGEDHRRKETKGNNDRDILYSPLLHTKHDFFIWGSLARSIRYDTIRYHTYVAIDDVRSRVCEMSWMDGWMDGCHHGCGSIKSNKFH